MAAETATLGGAEGGVDLFGAAVTLGASWLRSKNDVKTAKIVAEAALRESEAERSARNDLVKVSIGLVLATVVGTVLYRKFAR